MNLKSFKYIKVFLLFDKNISTLQPPIGLKEERCLQMSSLQKFWHSKRQKSFAVVFEEMIDWEKKRHRFITILVASLVIVLFHFRRSYRANTRKFPNWVVDQTPHSTLKISNWFGTRKQKKVEILGFRSKSWRI